MARVINSNIAPLQLHSEDLPAPEAGCCAAQDPLQPCCSEDADDSPATRALLERFGPDVRVLRRRPPQGGPPEH